MDTREVLKSTYYTPYQIVRVHTKDGKTFGWNDQTDLYSGLHVSKSVVTPSKDEAQIAMFAQGGKMPSNAKYIKRGDIASVEVADYYDEEPTAIIGGEYLYNGIWFDDTVNIEKLAKAKERGIMAKGGTLSPEEIEPAIKLNLYRAVGLDGSLEVMSTGRTVSAYRLIDGAVVRGLLSPEEITAELAEAAKNQAIEIDERYLGSGEGFGSSDTNFYIMYMLQEAGYNAGVKDGRIQRLAKGGRVVKIVNEGEKFDEGKYKAIFGDYDKDGTANIDDANPTDKTKKGRVEQVSMKEVFKGLLDVKAELDDIMYDAVDELDEKAPKDADIYARTKTPYSILKKLVEKRMLDPKKGLTDMVGTTIAVNTQKDLEKLRDKIDGGEFGKVLDRDDYYKSPKAGYRAYHYIVEYNGLPVEIQIKTKRQKKLGEVAHEFYKKGTLDAKGLDQLSKLFMEADQGKPAAQKKVDKLLRNKAAIAKMVSTEKMAKGGTITKIWIDNYVFAQRSPRGVGADRGKFVITGSDESGNQTELMTLKKGTRKWGDVFATRRAAISEAKKLAEKHGVSEITLYDEDQGVEDVIKMGKGGEVEGVIKYDDIDYFLLTGEFDIWDDEEFPFEVKVDKKEIDIEESGIEVQEELSDHAFSNRYDIFEDVTETRSSDFDLHVDKCFVVMKNGEKREVMFEKFEPHQSIYFGSYEKGGKLSPSEKKDVRHIAFANDEARAKKLFEEKFAPSKQDAIREYYGTLFRKGGRVSNAQKKKIAYVMGEFKDGKLKSSSGKKVTKRDQAIAIALSEAGVEKKGLGGIILTAALIGGTAYALTELAPRHFQHVREGNECRKDIDKWFKQWKSGNLKHKDGSEISEFEIPSVIKKKLEDKYGHDCNFYGKSYDESYLKKK